MGGLGRKKNDGIRDCVAGRQGVGKLGWAGVGLGRSWVEGVGCGGSYSRPVW